MINTKLFKLIEYDDKEIFSYNVIPEKYKDSIKGISLKCLPIEIVNIILKILKELYDYEIVCRSTIILKIHNVLLVRSIIINKKEIANFVRKKKNIATYNYKVNSLKKWCPDCHKFILKKNMNRHITQTAKHITLIE